MQQQMSDGDCNIISVKETVLILEFQVCNTTILELESESIVIELTEKIVVNSLDVGFSGRYFIPAGFIWLILVNFQSVVFGLLDIEGDLDIEGQLIMES